MKKQFTGTIKCTVDSDHPDYKYMTDEQKKNGLEFTDTYTFDIYDPITNHWGYWTVDETDAMLEYMKHDLALVAGGGYNTDHIHNVEFDIK